MQLKEWLFLSECSCGSNQDNKYSAVARPQTDILQENSNVSPTFISVFEKQTK